MPRAINRLSVPQVRAAKEPGMYSDGGGLYLRVAPGGSKQWVFRYRRFGKLRDMGLGSVHTFTLAEARDKARTARQQIAEESDPLEQRWAARAEAALKAARLVTFKQAAERYIADHRAGWKNAKHAAQWSSTLTTYVYPIIGGISVDDVTDDLIKKVLMQHVPAFKGWPAGTLWDARPDTAKRVKNRIEMVLAYQKTGLKKQTATGNRRPSLPYDELPAFMADLRQREGVSARALEYLILTTARTVEVIGARWQEIDFDKKIWTCPAERMKGRRQGGHDHIVPLAAPALALLRQLKTGSKSKFIFANGNNAPLSDMALNETVRRMNEDRKAAGLPLYVDPKQDNRPVVPHGFRSTFSTWRADRTSFTKEVAESALAHVSGDKVERAYNRGEFFNKRRRLMDAWAGFCDAPPSSGQVISIGRGAA